MKHYALTLVALVVLSGAAIWFVASRPSARTAPPMLAPKPLPAEVTPVITRPTPAAPLPTPANISPGQEASASTPAPAALGLLIAEPQEAKDRIRYLVSTFDPVETATIVRYLDHPDAEVRLEAASGLVVMGDMAAVAGLRLAAQKAEARQATVEAATMQEAAALLASPQANTVRFSPVPAGERTWQTKSRSIAEPDGGQEKTDTLK